MHLFSGDAPAVEPATARAVDGPSSGGDRLGHLEAEVAELRREVTEMREQLAAFCRQFE
jgi:uncharacterized protein YceH (UPF0502 family)